MTALPHSLVPRRLEYPRDLLWQLVVREIRIRYKRSVLGIVWALISPLLQLVVMVFVFGRVLDLETQDYPAFLFSALLAWSWFQSSMMAAAVTITGSRELVRRPGFPTAILPVVSITTNLVNYLLALPVLLAFVLFGDHLTWAVLLLPVVIAIQFGVTLGPAFVVASLQVAYRDTWHILSVILMLGFYVSPIFYAVSSVPDRFRWAYDLNPIALLIEAYRRILMDGAMPDWTEMGLLALASGASFFIGYRVFLRARDRFVEEI